MTLLAGSAGVQAIEQVAVPLTVPLSYLQARAADELAMDATGFSELTADACKRLELWNLDVAAAGEELVLTMSMRAHAGVSLWNACRGPGPLDAQVVMRLLPSAADDGQAVMFQALGAEVRDMDGDASLLTTPSRLLAESLLLPRLQAMRVDVGQSLRDIDGLIEQFLHTEKDALSPLAERGQLTQVSMVERGMQVELAFALREREPLAIPEPVAALDDSELAAWAQVEDELDGFLTVLVMHLAAQTDDRDSQLDLLALLLESRARIAELLLLDHAPVDSDFALPVLSAADDASAVQDGELADPLGETVLVRAPLNETEKTDPLRQLFLDSWSRLAAIAARLPQRLDDDSAGLRMAAFLAAGDALELVDALGPGYGIEVSRDGLRRLARMLMAGEAPVSFTPLPLAPDAELRALFGIDVAEAPELPTAPTVSWWQSLHPVASAVAQDASPVELLRTVFPQRATLDSYLGIVAELIADSLEDHWPESRLDDDQRELFEPLVRATAWKETCWRHYLSKDDDVVVIRSAVGAVGMMQIVGRVWRSVFDLERLEADAAYNVAAGIHILEHYFVDYAVRRGEHKQPGGANNLVKATYSAYNGGPSKLTRYRREDVAARAKAVDAQFYRYFEAMREQPWPNESRCYVR